MNSHSIEMTTIDVTTGRKYTVRKKLTPLTFTLISRASSQRQAGLERDHEDREQDGVAQRLPEHRVTEQPGEVVEPTNLRALRGNQFRVGERQGEGQRDGDENERDAEHGGRCDQPGRGDPL